MGQARASRQSMFSRAWLSFIHGRVRNCSIPLTLNGRLRDLAGSTPWLAITAVPGPLSIDRRQSTQPPQVHGRLVPQPLAERDYLWQRGGDRRPDDPIQL